MIDLATIILDQLGVAAFATTGALVASRKEMDLVGFALLATATGIGGGTLRDLVLGVTPVFWIHDPAPLLLCLAIAVIAFFTAHIPQSRYRLLLWLDAAGLAVFSVIGAERALDHGTGTVAALAMGVVTATFGGMIRDVLSGETPVVFSREIYVTAALLGAGVFIGALAAGVPRDAALIVGFAGAFALRGAALRWGWSLPRYSPPGAA